MPWNKDPDKAFPARHPREPGGLRQDILDEIADHLACAAEREEERQENEDEEAVWDRVLERFGNPDAIARTLWWDQMRETVMREWIQTGVMIVVTIAVLAGLAMMTRLVAGVGTANDAMREAMKQVAASNENLAKAMAEQRAGNEAMLKALSGIQSGGWEDTVSANEQFVITVFVRRGTPEGSPAPEVQLLLEGKGPNDEQFSVAGDLSEFGEMTFSRLSQGHFKLTCYDPYSQLSAEKTITLFAGQGAGTYTIVAPDVVPRPVTVDLGLPPYGNDERQLIAGTLTGTWESHDLRWYSRRTVAIGRALSLEAEAFGRLVDAGAGAGAGAQLVWDGPTVPPEKCILAGNVSVSRTSAFWRSQSGKWRGQRDSEEVVELVLQSEDATGAHFSGNLPDTVEENYAEDARLLLSMEGVPDEANLPWLSSATSTLSDSVVVKLGTLPALRAGEWHDGHMYAPNSGTSIPGTITSDHAFLGAPNKLALALPEEFMAVQPEGRLFLIGLAIDTYKKYKSDGGASSGRFHAVDDRYGNTLAAYALHGDWQSTEWPAWNPDSPEVVGPVLLTDEKPFWEASSETLEEMIRTGKQFVPIPREIFSNAAQPVTGVLLGWENAAENYLWSIEVDLDGNATKSRPCWIVTEPFASVAAEPAVKP